MQTREIRLRMPSARATAATPRKRFGLVVDEYDLTLAVAIVIAAVAISLALM